MRLKQSRWEFITKYIFVRSNLKPNKVKTLKKQCENMRSILMNKDEEIMKLKNDMPIKPKDGGTDRCDDPI